MSVAEQNAGPDANDEAGSGAVSPSVPELVPGAARGTRPGVRLRAWRLRAGLTQAEVAEQSGLTTAGVAALERDARMARDPRALRALADALRLSSEERRVFVGAITAHPSPTGLRRKSSKHVPSPVAAEHRLQASRPPLPSKITPPVARPRVVARPRLLRRLDGALEHALALVIGPAGFGKTTLLAEWAVHVGARAAVGWVSLEPGDTDPQRFWMGVLAALQARRPGLGAAALTHL